MSKAEKTRTYIIERTAPIFNAKGFAGTSMSDLEQATGLTKGSIYGNFKNKDEVAVEAFKYNLRQVTDAITQMIAARESYRDKLMVFPDFYRLQFGKGKYKFGCAIANTATEADDTHPLLRAKVNAGIQSWFKVLVHLIDEGKKKGEFKKNVDAARKARLIITSIEGGLLICKTTSDQDYLNTALDQVVRIITEMEV